MNLSLSPMAGREQKWKAEKDYVLNSSTFGYAQNFCEIFLVT